MSIKNMYIWKWWKKECDEYWTVIELNSEEIDIIC